MQILYSSVDIIHEYWIIVTQYWNSILNQHLFQKSMVYIILVSMPIGRECPPEMQMSAPTLNVLSSFDNKTSSPLKELR